MPSSAVRTFTDPDAYTAAIRAGQVELTVLERGQFAAKLTRIDFHRLWMQRFFDNLPRIIHSAQMAGRAMVKFRTAPGPSLFAGALEVLPTSILRHSSADNYHQRSSGSAAFGMMSLPVEHMASIGTVMAGLDLTPPKDPLNYVPLPHAMARLQRLHAAAGGLAERAPEILANPDADGLEQALIEAMVECLGPQEERVRSAAQGQHALVMRRFRRVVEESSGQPLYIPEVCKAIRVSSRTLQSCCQEHLGMGPKRYLLLRRMHLARRALRQAEHSATTVTDIATRYGFWQFGRFAIHYRSLFGELPSATLRQPPE